jgi:hypothetical protein
MKDALLDTQFSGCRALAVVVARANPKTWRGRLVWIPGDAPAVEPIGDIAPDPGERWQVCHDGTGAYDLWYAGTRSRMAIVKAGLSLQEASVRFKPITPNQ